LKPARRDSRNRFTQDKVWRANTAGRYRAACDNVGQSETTHSWTGLRAHVVDRADQAASLDRSGSVARFIIARILRIFPGLIACIGLMVLLGIAVTDCPARQYLMDANVLKYILAMLR
jgi:hypothetical protein